MNEQIRDFLSYDKETGLITWINVAYKSKYKVGDIAGIINNEGSLSITCLGRNYLAHKLANWLSGGEYSDKVVHLNGDRTDNRWCNLELGGRTVEVEATQDSVRLLFNYDSETGIFTRRIATGNTNNKGTEIGCINGNGYLQTPFANKLWLLHRLAFLYMTGEVPKSIDHKDRNPLNNAWDNLRACTVSENAANTKTRDSITGVKGIQKYIKGTGYLAQITKDGVVHRKGYRTQEEAETWLKETRERLHGEFARH